MGFEKHSIAPKLIASTRPRSLGELEAIFGMGPTRIKKYGAEILEIVAKDEG